MAQREKQQEDPYLKIPSNEQKYSRGNSYERNSISQNRVSSKHLREDGPRDDYSRRRNREYSPERRGGGGRDRSMTPDRDNRRRGGENRSTKKPDNSGYKKRERSYSNDRKNKYNSYRGDKRDRRGRKDYSSHSRSPSNQRGGKKSGMK